MIGYYAHHHGSGHVTRLQTIAAHLNEPVTGLSSRAAPLGWSGPWVRLERDDLDRFPAVVGSDPTARGVLHWAPLHHRGLSARMAAIAEWVDRERPSLVVADVSVEVALLARLCGVPVVVLAMPGDRRDRPHQTAYDLADALLVPWPRAALGSPWPDRWLAKAWWVGAFSRFDGMPCPPRSERRGDRTVLLLWGAGGKDAGPEDIAAARASTPGWTWVERGPDSPSPDLWRELGEADVVVTHAGQNAVAEVAAAGRPAVVVAQTRPFGEQQATARAVDELAAAVGLSSWPPAGAWPDLLERAVARGGEGWRRWSTGHGAVDAASHLDLLAAVHREPMALERR